MTEAAPARVRLRRPPRPRGRGLGWLVLLLVLAVGVIIGSGQASDTLQLANPDPTRITQFRAAIARLPDQPLVLVAMDPDLGTYAEIRPTLRAAFEDLLQRGASIAFVSVTAEGRAIAAAELERLLDAGTRGEALIDLGFVAGVEAGMVRLVDHALPADTGGPLTDVIAERGGGISAFDMLLLAGGIDVGPRSWVEQVGTRLPALPMVAVAPTLAQPELAPYLRTGQLVGLLATVRDGAAYTRAVEADRVVDLSAAPRSDGPPSSLAMLLGMLIALLVLAQQLLGSLPGVGAGISVVPADEEQP